VRRGRIESEAARILMLSVALSVSAIDNVARDATRLAIYRLGSHGIGDLQNSRFGRFRCFG
jgi:hypothetical protein